MFFRKKNKPLAFFIEDMRHFDYFLNVLQELNSLKVPFELVINDMRSTHMHNVSKDVDLKVLVTAQKSGFPFTSLSTALIKKKRYDWIVSTFTMKIPVPNVRSSIVNKIKLTFYLAILKYAILFDKKNLSALYLNKYELVKKSSLKIPEMWLASHRIHFPKGLDMHRSKFPNPDLDGIIDHYFCHGEFDKNLVESRLNVPVTVIGYPRYDHIENNRTLFVDKLRTEFNIHPDKEIITWIPSYVTRKGSEDFNFDSWVEYVKKLTKQYAVIVRPHPKRIENGANKLLELLQESGFYVDSKVNRDMRELYGGSRFILCDYGGVVFSAIYTDCQLILLNHAEHGNEVSWKENLMVYQIRDQMLNLNVNDLIVNPDLIQDLINDTSLWKKQSEVQSKIKKQLFGSEIHNGSQIAAQKIKSIIESH
jgi:hypothetical protein